MGEVTLYKAPDWELGSESGSDNSFYVLGATLLCASDHSSQEMDFAHTELTS